MKKDTYLLSNIILAEADKQFAPELRRSEKLNESFKETCKALDDAVGLENMREFNVTVDPETKEIHLELVVDGIWE